LLLIGATAWASDTAWETVVQERIQSNARAIQWLGDDPVAVMPAIAAVAHFSGDGVVLSDAEGELLSLSFVEWGRDGAMAPVAARQPTQGECIVGPQLAPDGRCIRSLARDHGTVTEWWIGLDAGLEQGWTVPSPPDGEGPIRFETEVSGALMVEASGDVGWLTDPTGQLWQVSAVVAWDALGHTLPSRIDARDNRLIVSVDDDGAVWPITVDPVYTTADSTLVGYDLNDQFGFSVSDAGDVNSDGYDDVIVGAPGVYGIGAAYIFEGASSGVDVDADASLSGSSSGDEFGYAVSGAGDVNGDGYDDVIIGAPGADDNGAVAIYQGSAAGIELTTGSTISSPALYAAFGLSVSGAGDVNGDGYDDVIVGAPYALSSAAYIHLGSSLGVEGTADAALFSPTSAILFGYAVSDAGDINDDGYDDVAVSAYLEANVFVGTSLGLDTLVSTTITGTNDFGFSLSGAGDVNGDGYDDIIVGYPAAESADVYLGSSSGMGTSGITFSGAIGSGFGSMVSDAGDVNGDGYDDIIVGSFSNQATVFHGSSSGGDTVAAASLSGVGAYGLSVSGAGDVNGDGYDDVIVGASEALSFIGEAHIYLGHCIDDDADEYCVYEDCDDADPDVNQVRTWYADSDGDGYGDVSLSVLECTPPSGYIADDSDCDDADSAANPGAVEVCDDIDNDCDGDIDEGVLSTWYADFDDDGYGDPGSPLEDCEETSGYVADDTDCDDEEPAAYPTATEICDELDNDCDGDIDEDLTETFYPDLDGDGFGNLANSIEACSLPSGYVEDSTDCDDNEATTHPGADDLPDDGIDGNCDGVDPSRWVQGGASCATTSGSGGWAGLLLMMVLLRRRTER
jgi:hypothetical protein